MTENACQFVVPGISSVLQTVFAQSVTRLAILARQPQQHVSAVSKTFPRTSITLAITHVFQAVPMDFMLMLAIFVKFAVAHAQPVNLTP